MNSNMPKDSGFDKTLSVLKEGYEFIMNRDRDLDTNIFETRILGEKAICLTGSELAELFYDNTRFRRSDAAPARVKKTLFGQGGVQGLDGDVHKNRKAMFMSLMDHQAMDEIEALTQKYWHEFFADKTSVILSSYTKQRKLFFLKLPPTGLVFHCKMRILKPVPSRFPIYMNLLQLSVSSIGKGVNQDPRQKIGFRRLLKMCVMARLKPIKREHCISSPCIPI